MAMEVEGIQPSWSSGPQVEFPKRSRYLGAGRPVCSNCYKRVGAVAALQVRCARPPCPTVSGEAQLQGSPAPFFPPPPGRGRGPALSCPQRTSGRRGRARWTPGREAWWQLLAVQRCQGHVRCPLSRHQGPPAPRRQVAPSPSCSVSSPQPPSARAETLILAA